MQCCSCILCSVLIVIRYQLLQQSQIKIQNHPPYTWQTFTNKWKSLELSWQLQFFHGLNTNCVLNGPTIEVSETYSSKLHMLSIFTLCTCYLVNFSINLMTGLDMQFVIKFIQERTKIYVIYCQNELRNNNYSFLNNIKNIQNDLMRYKIMLDNFPFKFFLIAILIQNSFDMIGIVGEGYSTKLKVLLIQAQLHCFFVCEIICCILDRLRKQPEQVQELLEFWVSSVVSFSNFDEYLFQFLNILDNQVIQAGNFQSTDNWQMIRRLILGWQICEGAQNISVSHLDIFAGKNVVNFCTHDLLNHTRAVRTIKIKTESAFFAVYNFMHIIKSFCELVQQNSMRRHILAQIKITSENTRNIFLIQA